MGQKIELEEQDIQNIIALCDIALKYGGMNLYNVVARILSLLPQPEAPKPEKE